jgi:ZIP family zinc transporter/zinc and cadmium transporter
VTPLAWGLVFSLVAAGGNLLGGYLVVRSARQRRFLDAVLSIGAGFMLAAVMLEMVPHSLEEPSSRAVAPLLVLVGYLLIQFCEHTLSSHFHFGEETHHEVVHGSHLGLTAAVGLGVHTFFDGVSIGSAFRLWESAPSLGFLVFFAIALHKLPEGFTMASIMVASGRSRRQALGATAALAAATLLGSLSAGLLHFEAAHYALALSAGVTLYVAASDLIPEVNAHAGIRSSLLVFAGVALFWLAQRLLVLAGLH